MARFVELFRARWREPHGPGATQEHIARYFNVLNTVLLKYKARANARDRLAAAQLELRGFVDISTVIRRAIRAYRADTKAATTAEERTHLETQIQTARTNLAAVRRRYHVLVQTRDQLQGAWSSCTNDLNHHLNRLGFKLAPTDLPNV